VLVVAAGPPYDPTTFGATVVATHRRLTRPRLRGRAQLPWPRALGTPPWAVARELTALTGVRHRTRLVRWSRPAPQAAGALFVGNRWLPRHVVLVVDGADPGRPGCYEPGAGAVVPVDLERLGRHEVAVAGWRYAWFSVSPGR
jgi:hypothetical protein